MSYVVCLYVCRMYVVCRMSVCMSYVCLYVVCMSVCRMSQNKILFLSSTHFKEDKYIDTKPFYNK